MKSIKKLIVMCTAGCLALLTAACGGGVADVEPQVPTVNVATLHAVSDAAKLQYPGRVKAAEEINLAFKGAQADPPCPCRYAAAGGTAGRLRLYARVEGGRRDGARRRVGRSVSRSTSASPSSTSADESTRCVPPKPRPSRWSWSVSSSTRRCNSNFRKPPTSSTKPPSKLPSPSAPWHRLKRTSSSVVSNTRPAWSPSATYSKPRPSGSKPTPPRWNPTAPATSPTSNTSKPPACSPFQTNA